MATWQVINFSPISYFNFINILGLSFLPEQLVLEDTKMFLCSAYLWFSVWLCAVVYPYALWYGIASYHRCSGAIERVFARVRHGDNKRLLTVATGGDLLWTVPLWAVKGRDDDSMVRDAAEFEHERLCAGRAAPANRILFCHSKSRELACFGIAGWFGRRRTSDIRGSSVHFPLPLPCLLPLPL